MGCAGSIDCSKLRKWQAFGCYGPAITLLLKWSNMHGFPPLVILVYQRRCYCLVIEAVCCRRCFDVAAAQVRELCRGVGYRAGPFSSQAFQSEGDCCFCLECCIVFTGGAMLAGFPCACCWSGVRRVWMVVVKRWEFVSSAGLYILPASYGEGRLVQKV